MASFARRQLVYALGSALAVLGWAGSAAATEPQRLIDRARLAIDEFHDDPNFTGMKVYLQNAYGVLIFPELLKAGLLVGVQVGSGVMVLRDPKSGTWGEPTFYDMYEGSFGLQIGGAATSAVFTLMNPGAIDKILANRFKIGTDASVAAGPIGPGVGAGTTARFGEDIYLFSRSRGLYGGLSVDGAAILPKTDWNRAYYGVNATPAQIMRDHSASNAGTAQLKESLARF